MFDSLADKLQGALGDLRKKGKLDEESISRAMREIRLALLEADVNFTVVRDFVARVREQAIGEDVLKSLTPGQQVVKVVHDELTALMGEGESGLAFAKFTVILLAGLQGSGKTTTAGKLALQLRKQGRKPGLIAADLQRPAAIDQLEQLGKQIQVPVYRTDTKDAVEATRSGLERARAEGLDTVIVDTAGRLQIDEELMEELARVRDEAKPHEHPARPRRDDRPGGGQRRAGLRRAHRVRRRDPHQARRRRARRRGALASRRSPASRSSSPRPARSSTRSRCSTPTGWPRASSAWATS